MDEDADEIDEGAVIFDHEVPCMEINELGEELDDKENMISWVPHSILDVIFLIIIFAYHS